MSGVVISLRTAPASCARRSTPREIAEQVRKMVAGEGVVFADLFAMEGVEARTWQTDDPEVAITEITHHGQSAVTGAPYRFTALGVLRVREGEIVRYDDYMDPIALARLLGRTQELATALSAT